MEDSVDSVQHAGFVVTSLVVIENKSSATDSDWYGMLAAVIGKKGKCHQN